MKKIVFILLGYFLFTGSILAKTKIIKDTYYEGEIKFYGLKYNLPEGKWLSLGKKTLHIGEIPNIGVSCIEFFQLEKKLLRSTLEICEVHTNGTYTNYIGMYFNKLLKKGRYDSCTLRPEYYYAKLWTKGMSSNCFKVRHIDVNKEIYFPDDPEDSMTFVKKAIQDYKVILPKTMLESFHLYFAPNVSDRGYEVTYLINPELHGAPETSYADENKSEYHRNNIEKYPEKKKFMANWTKESAKRHQEFELRLKAKGRHKLSFDDLGL